MKQNIIETVIGAIVILVAIVFLAFSYKLANMGTGGGGYTVRADFSGIGGLKTGDDVQISGVKIGAVSGIELDQSTYLATVRMNIDSDIKLPTDTAAVITSEGLLGGRYMALEPGGAEEVLENGGQIQYTQAPQNLEQLLGKFIFSASDSNEESSGGNSEASSDEGNNNGGGTSGGLLGDQGM